MPRPSAPPPRAHEAWVLVAARTVSALGDQLARVAVSVAVLRSSGSPLLAALAFAATFVPAVLGTALLSGVGDRWSRRTVLVTGDLLRGALVLSMTLPGVTVPVLFALVVLVALVDGPCAAARSALLRASSGSDARYLRVTSLDETLVQTAQVLGYALGGAAVLLLGQRTSLRLDALTFLLSAALVGLGVRRASAPAAASSRRPWADAAVGWRAALAPGARRPVLLTWLLVGAAVAPEGLAVVWALDRGQGALGAGLLLAANPLGSVLGLLVLSAAGLDRARAARRTLVAMALGPLLVCGLEPSFPLVLLLVALSGAGLTVTTVARVDFTAAVPDAVRARAFGIAGTGLIVAQGAGIALAGALAEVVPPGVAVALCAGAGVVGLALLPSLRGMLAGAGARA